MSSASQSLSSEPSQMKTFIDSALNRFCKVRYDLTIPLINAPLEKSHALGAFITANTVQAVATPDIEQKPQNGVLLLITMSNINGSCKESSVV